VANIAAVTRLRLLTKSGWAIWFVFLMLAVVLFIALAFYYAGRSDRLGSNGVEATATVTEKFFYENDPGLNRVVIDGYNFAYEWLLADGTTHRYVAGFDTEAPWNEINVGDTAQVTYLPSNPNNHDSPWGTQAETVDLWVGAAVMTVLLGLVTLPIALWRVRPVDSDEPAQGEDGELAIPDSEPTGS